ncbi:MAG: Cof-type HAD-IIB family hydrolase [Anaerolineae bacterium]
MPEPIRLVALDLDGTLLNEELHITPRTIAAIQDATAAGVHVTLATGRAFISTRPFAERLSLTTPLICYQGGVIGDPGSGRVLHEVTMSVEMAEKVIEQADLEDLDISLYGKDVIYFRKLQWPQEFYERWFGLRVVHAPRLQCALDETLPLKFIIIAEPPEADAIEARWKRLFDGPLHIVRSHRLFVEGNPPGASKGTALAWLARRLGVPREAVMAVGDNDNDRSMVEWAGVGVAMGSGAPSLQAVADWVAPGQAEDGAAVALERFALGRRA